MQPGALFADRFEIERTAGAGGMGTIWCARDRRGGGVVALKLLQKEVGEGGEVRFEREARVLAQLDHPGIVRCVDHGRTPEGIAWLAMEWLDGEDLAARLERGRLSVQETVTLGRRVADALAAAHARGVVHRDVKPSNLFLPDGAIEEVKVIDFGIARTAAERRATLSGVAVGTPSYMAPEQARGAREVDLRADVFSLGCVLFECLAGRPPFEGQHAMAILAKLLLEQAPDVGALVPGVPPALAALVARMLAKKPGSRPGGGLAVAAALAGVGSTPPVAAPALALTGREQRLVSVIVAGAPATRATADDDTLPASASREALGTLLRLLSPFGARVEVLVDGSLVAAVAGSGAATDQAARAARCALSMRDALPEGALALATGRGLFEADVPLGEAIDRAVALLRAEQHGDAGRRARIVLDAVTAGLLDARFRVEERDGCFELSGEREGAFDVARTLLGKPTPCVGRDRDIAAIEASFAECADDGTARAVLLTGPPGIGKSRVAQEVLLRVRSRGDAAAVWMARSDPMGAGSSRRLLAQMVTQAVGLTPGEPAELAREKLRAHVAGRLDGDAAPHVAEFLGELLDLPFPDEHRLKLRAARQDARLLGDQIGRALEDLLAAECARGPVLVIVEDLQWADPPSVAFLDTALRRFMELPLMVLAVARPEVHDRFPRLWAAHPMRQIGLADLPRKAAERLVRHVLGEDTPPASVARLVEHAAGNPFYLEELVRARAEGLGDAAPGTVLAMVQSRLEALSPAARRALRAGSVFGEAFWSGGVRALVGDADDVAEGKDPIAELTEREIVRPRESRFPGEEEHAFRHALVREAAYGMLTGADLTTGHRLAGLWLEQAGERDAMRLAEHFERGAERARAASWYQRAAEEALAANDLGAVVARAHRAVDLGARGEVLAAALVALGEAHLWRGEWAPAEPALSEALRLLEPGAAPWFRAAALLGWSINAAAADDRLRLLAEDVLREAKASPAGAALVTAARIGVLVMLSGSAAAADPFLALVAPALADPACDPLVAPHAHELMAMRAMYDGDLGATSAGLIASAVRFDAVGDERQALRVRVNAGVLLTYLGLYEQAEAELRAVIAASERRGTHSMTVSARINLAEALRRRGALTEARALLEEAIGVLAAQDAEREQGVARAYLAAALLGLGDLSGAEAEASRACELIASVPPSLCLALATLARVLLAQRRLGDALRAATEAMETLDQIGVIEEGDALVHVTFAEALHAAGEHVRARAAIAAARERLLASAARITDPAWRQSFLTAVREHARTLALAAEWVPARRGGSEAEEALKKP